MHIWTIAPETAKIILIYCWKNKSKLETTGTDEIAKQSIIRNLASFNDNLNSDSEILPPPNFITNVEIVNNEHHLFGFIYSLNINKLTLKLYGKVYYQLYDLIQVDEILIPFIKIRKLWNLLDKYYEYSLSNFKIIIFLNLFCL
ncbi:hypothetical protein F8M41_013971 [Gigaspora margarita]|uniref:Uncharacterized protein n=1 Tax=Gigaspora margarita TaxID=4874 RepID=A0A8H4EP47_GIGMA|nr:hypothetical protein F8M41_013971 [Gigaspora margarita]